MHPDVRLFRKVAERYLAEYHERFPQDASAQGLKQYDAELGGNDPATYVFDQEHVERTLGQVEAIPDDHFNADDWLDRRGFLAMLRTSLFNHERERWRVNPQLHCDAAVNAIFLLVVRNSDSLGKALPALESRLGKLPQFLEEGASCIRKPVPLWTDLAVQSCAGAETFLREISQQLQAVSPDPARTAKLIDGAIRAFRKYAASIQKKEQGAKGGYAIGRESFEFLSRERTGLSYSLPEIRAMGERLVTRLSEELKQESRKFGKRSATQIIEKAAARWKPNAGTLLEEYQQVTAKVRGQFEDAGLVSFPKGEKCRVMAVPAFLRHQFPTAAYLQPPAYSKDQTGIFWVNDLSETVRDPEKRAAEVRQHFGLDFTCAHEAYPGHHLQFVIQNQHPSKLRRLFHHAIFYEGWTLWCEKMAVDEGVIDFPEARLIQLHDALWRAHRIVIDCGLQDGSLSYQAACKRLQDGVHFTAARAKGDVNWYTSSPTIPMSYLLGRLEVERLHAHLVGREGWTIRQFNDWMLSHGALPWNWIWQSQTRTPSLRD